MPIIRPSSELRQNYSEISDLCHEYNEPVYITRNGTGDLAVMSIETYEMLAGKFELHKLINAGLEDIENGREKSVEEVFLNIESRLK